MTRKRKRTQIGAIPILPDWADLFRPYTLLTLCALLFLAQGTYAYVGPVTLSLTTDDYGDETSWYLTDSSGTELAYSDFYDNNTSYNEVMNLPIGTGYTFTIYDENDDGIESPGGYSVEDAEGTVIVSGGDSITTMGESMTFDIIDINDTLLITGTPATRATANEPYSFTPTADSNGEPLTFSITNLPTWASFDTSTGTLTGTPSTSDLGTTTNLEISVSNGSETATLATFDITVTPPLYRPSDTQPHHR